MKCSVERCNRPVRSNGLCNRHYMQMREHGHIMARTKFDPNDFIVEGSVVKIGIYNKNHELINYALIDSEDVEKCKPYKWCFDGKYISSKIGSLHSFVSGIAYNGKIVPDHKNRNVWDNRKENIRPATQSENVCNSKKPSGSSSYKGVSWHIRSKKWIATIMKNGASTHLGYFVNERDAAKAYNEKAKELHGEFAVLNKIIIKRRKSC